MTTREDILSLAEDLEDGVQRNGSMDGEDGAVDLYDIDAANEVMGEAAKMLRTLAAPTPPAAEAPGQEPVEVKRLEWREITEARSDEDPTHEPTGHLEADTSIGVYFIEMYLSSDSYGWSVALNGVDIADKDDPEDAKAAAQADYEQRIRSALVSAPPTYSDAEAKGQEPTAAEINRMADVLRSLGGKGRTTCDIAREAILAIRSLASPAPKGETPPSYIKCDDCNGTGLALDMSGEPGVCRECKGNTVVQEHHPHD